jgi:hypothetical protein
MGLKGNGQDWRSIQNSILGGCSGSTAHVEATLLLQRESKGKTGEEKRRKIKIIVSNCFVCREQGQAKKKRGKIKIIVRNCFVCREQGQGGELPRGYEGSTRETVRIGHPCKTAF